jgi:ParB family transcriptional regulator, chromosome partitioning protein
MIRTIPLNKLVPSPRNVRRRTDEQADLELKADVEARGLLQNLVVTAAGKPRGCFAVEAGERRRRALQALADEGKLPKDAEICCLVVEGASAGQEASLAENFQRLSMNPADECLAFQQLLEQGADVEGIARRFGLTMRFVEGRLRLAGLAPVVFEALGAGEISLDVAKAYAATPDRERQAWVYEQVGRSYAASHPDSIRRMMTQATVSAGDRRARLIGEDAYVAAGGRIERDLFSDEASARWLDVALLERLACEKMDAIAAETAAETGLAFVRPTLDSWIGHSHLEGLRRVAVETPPLSDEETARVDALEGEIEDLVDRLQCEEMEDLEREQAEAKIRDLGGQIDAIVDKRPVIDETLRPQVGTFLILDEQGRARLDTSYYAEANADTAGAQEDEANLAGGPACSGGTFSPCTSRAIPGWRSTSRSS